MPGFSQSKFERLVLLLPPPITKLFPAPSLLYNLLLFFPKTNPFSTLSKLLEISCNPVPKTTEDQVFSPDTVVNTLKSDKLFFTASFKVVALLNLVI